MTDFKVTDEAVEAAVKARSDAFNTIPPDASHQETMRIAERAAIEAALPVMFGEPVSWQRNLNPPRDWRGPYWIECTKEDYEFILKNGYWYDQKSDMNWPATTRSLYAIKEPK